MFYIFQSSVYVPNGKIKESGAVFHIVLRNVEDNSLSSYVTRVYKPLEVSITLNIYNIPCLPMSPGCINH
jgi:hypothetical protein